MRIVTFALFVLIVLPVWASEPGEPPGCEVWMPSSPQFTCAPLPLHVALESQQAFDSESNVFRLSRQGFAEYCDSEIYPMDYTWVSRVNYVTRMLQDIGGFQGRCVGTGDGARDSVLCPVDPCRTHFDKENGRLLIELRSQGSATGDEIVWVAAIEGFATTFEILQTYTPTSGRLGFAVPYQPEGFQYADYFDTYWGDLATVGDWSLAQPLQCGYPATAPSVGDYLTVDDTLPTPAPGQGYYYVTAVNYLGQRRYGRQANGGVLSGRNPAALPSCTE